MLFEAEEHVETIEEEPEETQGWRSWFQCGSGSRAMGAVPQLNLETCMRAFCAPETLTADAEASLKRIGSAGSSRC